MEPAASNTTSPLTSSYHIFLPILNIIPIPTLFLPFTAQLWQARERERERASDLLQGEGNGIRQGKGGTIEAERSNIYQKKQSIHRIYPYVSKEIGRERGSKRYELKIEQERDGRFQKPGRERVLIIGDSIFIYTHT